MTNIVSAKQIMLIDILRKELGLERIPTSSVLQMSRRNAHYMIRELIELKRTIKQREERV